MPWVSSPFLRYSSVNSLDASPDAVEDAFESLREGLVIAIGKQPQGGMTEHDRGPALDFLEPVLDVRGDAERHHQRTGDFQQRGALDGLHVPPQVPVVVAQIAEPAPAGPGFERHGHGHVVLPDVRWTQLFEERGECCRDRGAHECFVRDVERQVFDGWCGCGHDSSCVCCLSVTSLASCPFDYQLRSARSLMRTSWFRQ